MSAQFQFCHKCGKHKKIKEFSKSQLRKRKRRRCKKCRSKHKRQTRDMNTHKVVCDINESWKVNDEININIETKSNTAWIPCTKIHCVISQIIQLNNYTFLTLSKSNELYVYHTQNDAWIQPTNLQNKDANIKSIAYDYDRNEIYILAVLNKNKGRIMRFKYDHKTVSFRTLRSIKLGEFSDLWTVSSIFVNGTYHFVRDRCRNLLHGDSMAYKYEHTGFHYTYDPNTNKTPQQQSGLWYFYGDPLMYFKEQNKLILFRGFHTLQIFSFDTNQWSETCSVNGGYKTECNEFYGCILSEDKQKLIIFGSSGNDNYKLETNEIQNDIDGSYSQAIKRTIQFPCSLPEDYIILSSKNDFINHMFIYGYYRMCLMEGDEKYKNDTIPILPMEIVSIILYVNKEIFVHAFSKRKGFHFKIAIQDLYLTPNLENVEDCDESGVVFPVEMKILSPQDVYNNNNPFVFGVRITRGSLRLNTPIVVQKWDEHGKGTPIYLGTVDVITTGLTGDNKNLKIAKLGEKVYVKIVNYADELFIGDPIRVGKEFEWNDPLISEISRESIDALKINYEEEVKEQQRSGGDLLQHIVLLKKYFSII